MNLGQDFMMRLMDMFRGCDNNQHQNRPPRPDNQNHHRGNSIFDQQGGCNGCKKKQKPPKMPPFQGQNRANRNQRPPKGHGIFEQCNNRNQRPQPRPTNGNWFNSPRPNERQYW